MNLESTGRGTSPFSVLPQWYGLLFDALLGDDANPKSISGVDISLCGRDEDIFDQLNRLLLSQRNMLHTLHVLETNLWKDRDMSLPCPLSRNLVGALKCLHT